MVKEKELYTAYYGWSSMHSCTGTARGLFNYLKRLRDKVELLIDSLHIYKFGEDIEVNLSDLYTQDEINQIYGF